MAFQIRDDIFDYTPSGIIGKPVLNDIKEQKMTLPLIYALSQASVDERKRFLAQVRRDPKSSATAAEALRLVNDNGGLAYAAQQIDIFASQAKEALAELPDSEARQALSALVDYNTKRKK